MNVKFSLTSIILFAETDLVFIKRNDGRHGLAIWEQLGIYQNFVQQVAFIFHKVQCLEEQG